ncbi:MAG: GreA/GreB family elongation factor [bacterium]
MSNSTLTTTDTGLPRGIVLTSEGRAAISERIDRLRIDVLDRLRPHLMGPERDERDMAEFERTLAEVGRLEGVIAAAQPMPATKGGRGARVQAGSVVEIESAAASGTAKSRSGKSRTFAPPTVTRTRVRLVHPEEATIDEERISWDSPLARALLGARAGDIVEVASPRGPWACTVRRVVATAG